MVRKTKSGKNKNSEAGGGDTDCKRLQRASTEELKDVDDVPNKRRKRNEKDGTGDMNRSSTADTVDISKIVGDGGHHSRTGSTATQKAGVSNGSRMSDGCPLSLVKLFPEGGWKDLLMEQFQEPYMETLQEKLKEDYQKGVEVFPPKDLIFNAFKITQLHSLKVVILGQDPYHDDGQAHGLSFSVPDGLPIPPSLKNIYKELLNDCSGFVSPTHGCLLPWAEQGVLLLNATLTVKAHQANSHSKYGWQKFTDSVISAISEHCNEVVFLLWGGFAHKKEKLVNSGKHTVIKTAHPSPLSFGKFYGCKCFSSVNKALKKYKAKEIDWKL